jgi:hypothetical protein
VPLTDTLHLIAELAVAFAGFASLGSIIGSRRGRDAPEIDATRIRGMLEASLLVAAFSLVPILGHEAGLSIAVSWQSSSCLFSVVAASIMALHTRRAYAFASFQMSLSWRASAFALWLVALGALLATAVGAVQKAGFGYALGLFALLVYAGLLFIRLVVSLLEGGPERGAPAA